MINKKKFVVTLLVGMMALTLVSAVLVYSLSNTITAKVEFKSPMVLGISDYEGGWTEELLLDEMYTGGNKVVTFYTREENIADESVTGNTENIIYNSGITCGDFDGIELWTKPEGSEDYAYIGDIMHLCEHIEGDNYVTFIFPNQEWNAGEVEINKVMVTFNNVVGKYRFTSQVVPTA